MNYPVWQLPTLGGGSLIAIIAVLHVYIAQLAVGGGALLWWMDRRAWRDGDAGLESWVRRHVKFFMLLTMVAGGVTGVAIWFVIGLVHPAATSTLIHAFVWGWAVEWVFFGVEIVSLLLYHYRFDSMPRTNRLAVAFIYAASAWLSLVVINGILSFMLTPGAWLQTHDFMDGFLNPTWLSSTVFRSFVCVVLAGLFGAVTAVREGDAQQRRLLLRSCVGWIGVGAVGVAASGLWFLRTVPVEIRQRALVLNPESAVFIAAFLVGSAAVVVLGALLLVRLPRGLQAVLVAGLVLFGLVWTGGFEYLREIARKPYIISGYMYANGLLVEDMDALDADGVLARARWVEHHDMDDQHRLQVGRELFDLQCHACHTPDGWYNALKPRTSTLTVRGAEAMAGLGEVRDYMPPFVGTADERRALATWIVDGLGEQRYGVWPEKPAAQQRAGPPPLREGDYVLLAWNDLGMHCVSDAEGVFEILPPGNTLQAVLIHRGGRPEKVTGGVTLRYRAPEGHEHPSRHVALWEMSAALLGAPLAVDAGLDGAEMSGAMRYDPDAGAWSSGAIPVVPYTDDGGFDPYPVFTIQALGADGALLASTQVVAPVTTELRCLHCHGPDYWGTPHGAGLNDVTASNILLLHDRDNDTHLAALAGQRSPGSAPTATPTRRWAGRGIPSGSACPRPSTAGTHTAWTCRERRPAPPAIPPISRGPPAVSGVCMRGSAWAAWTATGTWTSTPSPC